MDTQTYDIDPEGAIENHMALEAYSVMQKEAGSKYPDLRKLAMAHRAISAVGTQDIKEAYMLECKMRMMFIHGIIK